MVQRASLTNRKEGRKVTRMSLRLSLKVRCLDYSIDGTMQWQCPPGLVLIYTERHDWMRISCCCLLQWQRELFVKCHGET